MSGQLEPRTAVRIAWYTVAAFALAGYAAIVAPCERRLGAIESHARELYDLADRNEQLVRGLGPLIAARDRVARDLKRLASENTSGKAAVAVLTVLQQEAAQEHVVVSGVSRAAVAPSPGSSGRRGEEMTVLLQGRYRDVLAAIADLPRHDALIEIRDVALARVDGSPAALFPNVEATVDATVYHDAGSLTKEEEVVRTAAP